jgi:hypothetical protein
MAIYRSVKNISLQGEAAEPHVVGEFDFESREYVYTLSAADEKKFAPGLLSEGAYKASGSESDKSDD